MNLMKKVTFKKINTKVLVCARYNNIIFTASAKVMHEKAVVS